MKKNLSSKGGDKEEKQNQELAWNLFINTCKCIAIAHVLIIGHEFSKGKRYYLVYLKASIKACMFGFLYSVYFNDEKLEYYLAKKRIANMKPI